MSLLDMATTEEWDAVRTMGKPTQVESTGGSTSYYELPPWAKELRHLMEFKEMTPDQANIFKAAYRLGEKKDVDMVYDLNKIIFFANCMKEKLLREEI